MTPALFTIGCGEHSRAEFIALLQHLAIEVLVDVRAHPESDPDPHCSEQSLREMCVEINILYHWAGRQLGEGRKAQKTSLHIALQNDALRGYADHMGSDLFQKSAQQLVRMAGTKKVAIMCAEKVAVHCHCQLLADYLTLQGVLVNHVLDQAQLQEHHLSSQARRESAALIYDRQEQPML